MQTDTMTIWAVSIATGFLLFRILSRRPKPSLEGNAEFESEMNDILTSDKYKVKGRFD